MESALCAYSISPLLANIALHGLEDLIKKSFPRRQGRKDGKRWDSPTPNIIRYADDFVVLHKEIEVIERCKSLIETWLKDMGLELKPEKTRISHTLEEHKGNIGFEFLGFHIQQYKVGKYKSGVNGHKIPLGFKTRITPSKNSIKNHLVKIEEVIDKHRASKPDKIIGLLNPIIRGWCNYYKGVISSETFKLLDHLTYQKLRRWAKRRHPNKGKKWVKNKYWKPIDNRNWIFSNTHEGKITYKLINHSDTKIIRHIKVRGVKSPYDGDFVYWSQRLSAYPETPIRVRILLKRQKAKCTICKLSFTNQDILEVDHIKPISLGGKDTYKNLQLLHRHCHDNKSRQDYLEWQKQKYS
ncbi:group II intron maturase-specific domain-containing protein [Myxosarcina sp. GI1]|uniref:group II intron reverse transcriptase n=1 Tax=Myxosarcina sp. GI1 TaxID=1541065 RepID=UPI00068C57A6|nr:group II intron maturase-specific domain-containing protein [Myxosarcina sp. GI1]